MSSFICEFCGKEIIDTEHGYITGCKHYPIQYRPHQPLNPKTEVFTSYTSKQANDFEHGIALEYRILKGKLDHVQKVLNQWRHDFKLDILHMSVYEDTVYLLVIRSRVK